MEAAEYGKEEGMRRVPFWRRLTLWQQFVAIIVPLTLLSMVIAVGSIWAHQQAMHAELPPEAWKSVLSFSA